MVSPATVPDRVRALLAARGLAWSAPIEHFESIGSTNDHLKQRGREGAPEWSVALAEHQTAGRGRQGAGWLSPPGNLALSVLLRPRLPPQCVTLLPLAAGVAVAEAVGRWGIDGRLKWPNDVLASGRKLAGILAEASSGGRLDAVVLGIGINVRLDPRALPAELREGAASMAAESGRDPDPLEVAAEVLARLRVWYDALAREPSAVVAAWRGRAEAWWGLRVEVRSGDEVLRGVARDVDERGALLLETTPGRVVAVLSGEARELRLRP